MEIAKCVFILYFSKVKRDRSMSARFALLKHI